MLRSSLILMLACAAAPLNAGKPAAAPPPNPQIDYPAFRALTNEVEPYRQTRLIDWQAFVAAPPSPTS